MHRLFQPPDQIAYDFIVGDMAMVAMLVEAQADTAQISPLSLYQRTIVLVVRSSPIAAERT
ncbi:MAG: hypothetical protein BGN95_14895 [Sphingomonas sp. 66-10]|nr:MAG: hypothetical protein BGN95_14895 [Sphingomonas sp. 66-10]